VVKLDNLQKQWEEERRAKTEGKPEAKVEGNPTVDNINKGIAEIDAKTKEIDAKTRHELAIRNLASFKDWEEEKKRQQDELRKKSDDLSILEKSIKEREVEISGKEFVVETDTKKNREWSDKLERAEKGLKGQVADFLTLKGKDREILRIEVERLMKLLCIPLVPNQYRDGYTFDCIDNIISQSIKITASVLEQRCKVKPLYNDDGSYLDSEARKRLGYRLDGSKYAEWEEKDNTK
jgi:hypothetical protein